MKCFLHYGITVTYFSKICESNIFSHSLTFKDDDAFVDFSLFLENNCDLSIVSLYPAFRSKMS